MKLTKDHPTFERFLSLTCRLSPENLSCDGECSEEEIRDRRAQITISWAILEFEAGFNVTENDVWDAELAPEADDPNPGIDPNEERDQFRSDAEADADVLRSAGYGADEDYGGDCERL